MHAATNSAMNQSAGLVEYNEEVYRTSAKYVVKSVPEHVFTVRVYAEKNDAN